MKKFLVMLLAVFSFSACNNRPAVPEVSVVHYDNFPQEQTLKGEVVELDTALFRYPYRIRVAGDKAVVMDLHGIDFYGQLFRYPDFRHLSSFGKRGESPAEVLSMENVRLDAQGAWTLESNRNLLTRWSFSSSGDSLIRIKDIALEDSILRALDFVQTNDSTFIIPDYSGNCRFFRVNAAGKLVAKVGAIPTTNEEALRDSRPALAQAWRSFFDYCPGNETLAAATQLGEVIEIYNLKDSTRVVCIGPNGEPQFQVSGGYGIPTGIMGFSDVQVTDRAVYAVFQGISFKELMRQDQQGKVPDGGSFIYAFTLQGDPLCKYVLDHHVGGFWVDESTRTILAVDVNSDQPIVKFKF